MQHFETFKARRVTIGHATAEDLKAYKRQLVTHNPVEDRINIFKDERTSYLSIKNEDGKLIGVIQIDEIDDKTANVKICVPNISWKNRYGTESLHQFIKCCYERKLYSRVYFKKDNSIVKKYNEKRPYALTTGHYIDIA